MNATVFTVVATDHDEVRATAEAWTRLGLLRPSVWLRSADLDDDTAPVMAMEVTLLTRDGAVPVTLRDVFGEAEVTLVQVVAVRQVVGDVLDGELPRKLWGFSDRLVERLSTTTKVLRLNVVAPDAAPVRAKGLPDAACDLNVVVSPEDRPREGAADHGVDSRDRQDHFDAHTALACVTVARLWSHADGSALDTFDRARAGVLGTIVLARSAARVIDSRHLPVLILDELLGDDELGIRARLQNNEARPISDEAVVDTAAKQFIRIEHGALSYQDRRTEPEPVRGIVRRTFRMALRIFARLLLRRTMSWTVSGLKELEESVEAWLIGATPDEPGKRWTGLNRPTPREIIALASQAPELMPRVPPPHPRLWAPLRKLAFALIDQGKLPDEFAESWNNIHPVVSHPRWVTVDPHARFELLEAEKGALVKAGLPSHAVRPGDTNAANRLQLRLDSALRHLEDNPNLSPENRKAAVQALNDCRERLDVWREGGTSDKSLIGRLAKHVDQQITAARNALDQRGMDYRRENEERERALADLETIRRRVFSHFGWLGLGLSVMVLVLWSSLSFTTLASSVGDVLLGTAVFVTVAALVWAGTFLLLARRATALENELKEIEARRKATIQAVSEWPTEAQRLGALYEILVDWGEILGWMLYRPFGERVHDGDRDGLSVLDRPEALRSGTSSMVDGDKHRVVENVAARLFRRGWLSDLYDGLLDAVIPERAEPGAVLDAKIDPDRAPGPARAEDVGPGLDERVVEGDPGYGTRPPRHARDLLLRSFRDDKCAAIARARLESDVRATMRVQAPKRMMSDVITYNGGQEQRLSAVEFLRGVLPKQHDKDPTSPLTPRILSDEGRVHGTGRVQSVHLWGSVNRMEESGLDVPNHDGVVVHPPPNDPPNGDDPLFITLIRLDLTASCEEFELALPGYTAEP